MKWWDRIALSRHPDFIIEKSNDPYLRRWWLLPRNPVFNAYLHHFLKSDDNRAMHDHMYVNLSVLLEGEYHEHTTRGITKYVAGQIRFRWPSTPHRIELRNGPCWSLFLTGPRVREWGFHCPHGWRHWSEYTATDNKGEIGRGCD